MLGLFDDFKICKVIDDFRIWNFRYHCLSLSNSKQLLFKFNHSLNLSLQKLTLRSALLVTCCRCLANAIRFLIHSLSGLGDINAIGKRLVLDI
jgi:hypothetical protein